MYVVIYRLESEDFKYDHYVTTNAPNLRGAFVNLYTQVFNKSEGILSAPLFVKAINGMNTKDEWLEFFLSMTEYHIEIMDIFMGCCRVELGPTETTGS